MVEGVAALARRPTSRNTKRPSLLARPLASSNCSELLSDPYTSISAVNAPRIRQKHVASRIARSRGSTRSTDSGFWDISPPQICLPSQIGTPHPRSDNGNREEDRRSGYGASVGIGYLQCQCTFTLNFLKVDGDRKCIRGWRIRVPGTAVRQPGPHHARYVNASSLGRDLLPARSMKRSRSATAHRRSAIIVSTLC
jgi:hypothetical protein